MEKRQYSLDFLKIVATVFILFHHYQQYISGMFNDGINFYGGVYNFGYMVEFFFILSGYFMYPYIQKIKDGLLFKQFYLPRYIRLIPMVALAAVGYQIVVLCHIKLVGAAWFMESPDVWKTIVAAMGFQEGWVFKNNTYVNYPVWYVSVLLICYLIFYMVTYFSKRCQVSARYFYLAFIFVGIAINSYGWHVPFFNEYTARGYYAFFTGVLLATYCYERYATRRETLISLGIVAVVIDLIVFHRGFILGGVNYISTFVLFPAIIMLFKNPVVCKVFKGSGWQTAASVAFNAFLWHMPLLIILLMVIGKVQTGISFMSRGCMWGFLVIEIIIGMFSYFLIERKFKKWRKD